MDSWKFILEIHWTWSELHGSDCSITGVFSSGRREVLGDFPGLCKILHETTHPGDSYGTPWDACRAYLSFLDVGRDRFVLAVLHVEDGSYWSTMVSGGLDLILHCWSAGTSIPRGSGRGLLSPLVSALKR